MEAGYRRARWIAAHPVAGAAPAPALWIEAAAVQEETASGIAASLPLPAAETAAHSAAPRAVQAVVPRDPAAAGALPALEVEVLAAVAADGDK